jgi:hypothetical protein
MIALSCIPAITNSGANWKPFLCGRILFGLYLLNFLINFQDYPDDHPGG